MLEPMDMENGFSLSKYCQTYQTKLAGEFLVTSLGDSALESSQYRAAVDWMENRRQGYDNMELYIDYVKEMPRYPIWWQDNPNADPPILLVSRRKVQISSPPHRTPHHTFDFDLSVGSQLYCRDANTAAPGSFPDLDYDDSFSPPVTQDILRRNSKLIYSTMDAERQQMEWIVVEISGLPTPTIQESFLNFGSSQSRVVGFIVDSSRGQWANSLGGIHVLDY